MKLEITTLLARDGRERRLEMRFSLSWTPVIVRAVLHQEFVRPASDKLLGVHRAASTRTDLNLCG